MKTSRIAPVIAAIIDVALILIGLMFAMSGCRTAGPTVRISHSPGVRVEIQARTRAEQGKSVPVDVARGARVQAVPAP